MELDIAFTEVDDGEVEAHIDKDLISRVDEEEGLGSVAVVAISILLVNFILRQEASAEEAIEVGHIRQPIEEVSGAH